MGGSGQGSTGCEPTAGQGKSSHGPAWGGGRGASSQAPWALSPPGGPMAQGTEGWRSVCAKASSGRSCEPQGKQAGSNGNQSAGQMQQEPPPPWFPWGRSPGGGALAQRPQQMWPVQGWREGRRSPGSRALGRGRLGLEAMTSPWLSPPPPGGLLDSLGGRWVLLANFLLPVRLGPAPPTSTNRSGPPGGHPCLLSEVPEPVSGGRTGRRVLALAL